MAVQALGSGTQRRGNRLIVPFDERLQHMRVDVDRG